MNRRDLLKAAVPVAALGVAKLADGVHRVDLAPAGHFLFFVDRNKIDIADLADLGVPGVPLMPEGSKGGWIVAVDGDVDSAIRMYRMNDEPPAELNAVPLVQKYG